MDVITHQVNRILLPTGHKIHWPILISLLNLMSPIGFTSILDILQHLNYITPQRLENWICFRLGVEMEMRGSDMAGPLGIASLFRWEQRIASTQCVKYTVHPKTCHEGPEKEQRYSSTLSLISALDGGGWSTLRRGEELRYPGWDPQAVSTCAENLVSIGIRPPDRPARSESQYRLRYAGPPNQYVRYCIIRMQHLIGER
jgi:hypothetical protein